MRTLLGTALIGCVVGLFPFLWASRPHPGAWPQTSVPDFSLVDSDDHAFFLSRHRDAHAIVIVSYSVGCPIVRQSIPALKELVQAFKPRGVVFAFIDPVDERDAVARAMTEYGLDLPVLLDGAQIVTRTLGFTRSAEAAVLEPKSRTIVYRGAIDDGTPREKASHAWLADALEAVVGGRRPAVTETECQGSLFKLTPLSAVSYSQDVVPTLAHNCVFCHGARATTPIHTYAEARKFAPMIRETVLTHRMPPGGVDPAYGSYANRRMLSPYEVRVLVAWVDQGARADRRNDAPIVADAPPETSPRRVVNFRKPDFIWRMPHEMKVPPTGSIHYRYFQIGGQVRQDRWVEAVSAVPSNPSVVHHAAVLILPKPLRVYGDETTAGRMTRTQDWNDRIEPIGFLNPGRRWKAAQPGTAFHVPRGSYIALQLHYGTTGKPEVDRTRVCFWYYRGKHPIPLHITYIQLKRFVIPAGARNMIRQAEYTFDKPVAVLSFGVHMHLRGVGMRFLARYPDGRQRTLLSMPFYNFGFQRAVGLKKPFVLPRGTRVIVEGRFDNSAQNPQNPDAEKEVPWGKYTETNEMFKGSVTYIDAADLPRQQAR